MNVNEDNRSAALQELSEKLKTGIAHFAYAKAEGEHRVAFGTLNPDLMPIINGETFSKLTTAIGLASRIISNIIENLGLEKPLDKEGIEMVMEEIESLYPQTKNNSEEAKKPARKVNESLQTYYDFEAKGFRSFKKDNLVKIY